MSQTESPVRNISDTARWVAVYRARETDRPDALFRDPFARRLAGERGELIATSMPNAKQGEWAWSIRTLMVDRLVLDQIKRGTDLVINLAAGLDTRPYRLDVPHSLQWMEIDLPEILEHKEQVLANEKPRCRLERKRMDLSDVQQRRELFQQLGRQSSKACIICEGLLIYLTAEHVGALAQDLAAVPSFQHWIVDIASPGLLRIIQRGFGKVLTEAGSPLRFAPEEGPEFFTQHGWKPVVVYSMLKEAAKAKRLPWLLRLISFLPEPKHPGKRPWSGVCLLGKIQP
jgi:methyltransferase (TIGR00027 family)